MSHNSNHKKKLIRQSTRYSVKEISKRANLNSGIQLLSILPNKRSHNDREILCQWIKLQDIACFKRMKDEEIFELTKYCTLEEYNANDLIFKQNEASTSDSKFYVLLRGSISIWIENNDNNNDNKNEKNEKKKKKNLRPPAIQTFINETSNGLNNNNNNNNNNNSNNSIDEEIISPGTPRSPMIIPKSPKFRPHAPNQPPPKTTSTPIRHNHRRRISTIIKNEFKEENDINDYNITKATRTYIATLSHNSRKNYFGELSLMYNKPRGATIKAETNVKCLCVNSSIFRRLLRKPLTDFVEDISLKLGKFDGFRKVKRAQLRKLALYVNIRSVPVNSYICKEGDIVHDLMLVVKGEIALTRFVKEENRSIQVSTVTNGGIIGDYELLSDPTRKRHIWTAKALGNCIIYHVRYSDFIKRIRNEVIKYLKQKSKQIHLFRLQQIKHIISKADINNAIEAIVKPNIAILRNNNQIIERSNDMEDTIDEIFHPLILPSVRRRHEVRIYRKPIVLNSSLPSSNTNSDITQLENKSRHKLKTTLASSKSMPISSVKLHKPIKTRKQILPSTTFGANFEGFGVDVNEVFRLLNGTNAL